MVIKLQNIGKKFNYSWIFRGIDQVFEDQTHYAITGYNGSGKSTLLKVLSGILTPTEGKIDWVTTSKSEKSQLYRSVAITSPHSTLIEEFTLVECIHFQLQFKPFINNLSPKNVVDIAGLSKSADKPLTQFSSGMKQRVKLVLSLLTDNQLVILDEPCTNLDNNSTLWYQNLVNDFTKDRLVIIGSNQPQIECVSCTSFMDISQ